jgi:peptidoglycan/LPS O-acetylase OafA/YrhL
LGVTFWLFALLIFWLGKLPLAEIRRMALSQSLAIAMFSASMFMATSFKPNRVLDALATISYPLYITHLVVGWATLSWCLSNSVPPFIALLVAIALALFAAWCLHRLVEKPSVALTKKWRSAKAASS